MWGNTSMTSASPSSRHLASNTNIQNLEISKLCTYRDTKYILKIFQTSSNISSSVKQSYLEFQISKKGVLYMVRNLKILSTTFIQITCPDSIVMLTKNRTQLKLFQIPDCAKTSTLNSNISQTRSDMRVILEALEIYLSLVIPIKIS